MINIMIMIMIMVMGWLPNCWPQAQRWGGKGANHTFSRNVCPSLHEATLFQEMCAPLARNHTFPINVCPLLHETILFREMCAPLARNHTFPQKHRKTHAPIREQLLRNLPNSQTQRTQGRNIPLGGTPHSDNIACQTFKLPATSN